ncbi:MAG: hypothetical protein KDD48_01150 [Bdellovibrionales bacterium]|nr:hypothetical protein [Bdellovibrionales bacterium]
MKKLPPQTKLVLDVLKLLHEEKVLDHVLLVGSWCMFFYKDLFPKKEFSALRTRDMDFLVPLPCQLKSDVDIQPLLEKLGFLVEFHSDGSMSFDHPELMIDFLVPEKGPPKDKPVNIKQLHIKAQALRFMDILLTDPVQIKYQGITMLAPHPVRFGFHKVLISTRRQKKDKAQNDLSQGVDILSICHHVPTYKDSMKTIFESFHKNQRKVIESTLNKINRSDLL